MDYILFCYSCIVLISFPFKGESALKILLTHFSAKKDFEAQLIEKYQSIATGLQEENKSLRDRISKLEAVIDELRKTEDKQQEEINILKLKLINLEG